MTRLSAVAIAGLVLLALPAQSSASVPAFGRSWELVTLRAPASASVRGFVPMGDSGDRMVYRTFGPPPNSRSGAFLGAPVAMRGPTEWSTEAQGFPYDIHASEIFEELLPNAAIAYSEDLRTTVWLSAVPLTPDAPPEGQVALYRSVGEGDLRLIAKVGEGVITNYSGFTDISANGERVIFTTPEHLLPGDAGRTEGESVYAWDETTGLQMLDVGSGGALLSACGSSISHANGMSASANRVFFTTGACGGTRRVYMRDLDAGTTTEISASQCTRVDCGPPQDVTFAGATSDGSKAFLVTAQQLTNDDQDSGLDLYAYDVASGQLHLLSGGSAASSGEVIVAPVYPSDDGSRVYFRASGELIPGEVETGEKLFLADEGGVRRVATAEFGSEPVIQVSRSGERALFVTPSQVVAADTDSQADVYMYDALESSVTRISAGPSGGNAEIPANLNTLLLIRQLEPGDENPLYGIDGSGDRIVFVTAERLIPADVNEKLDVYEWHEGQLGLVSPGNEERDSEFGGISRDGKTVLFKTNATLTWQDEDGGDADFYAARLEGGFPEPPVVPACGGVTCAAPSRAPLVRSSPASARRAPAGRRKRIRLLGIEGRGGGGSSIGPMTKLRVAVPKPGLVTASVWVRHDGKNVVLARARHGAVGPGRIGLELRLTAAGRGTVGATAHSGWLRVSQQGAGGLARRVELALGGGR